MNLILIISAIVIFTLAVRLIVGKKFDIVEMLITILFCSLLAGGSYFIALKSRMADTQILSGEVIGKYSQKVHCRHSYSCNCVTHCSGSAKTRSCHRVCQTCYEHSHDVDWVVKSNIDYWTINTIDRQGLREPPRWTKVQNGDPVSTAVSYENILMGVPDSVFRNHTNVPLPPYPNKIYDYYKVDRLVLDGVSVDSSVSRSFNDVLSEKIKKVAVQKKVNLVVVLTNRDRNFVEELKAGWINGKKNDLVVVIGTKNYPEIEWVDSFGWSSNQLVFVKTRDDLLDKKIFDNSVIDIALDNAEKYWHIKPMSDYEYLREEVTISTFGLVILIIVVTIAFIGLTIHFVRNTTLYRK